MKIVAFLAFFASLAGCSGCLGQVEGPDLELAYEDGGDTVCYDQMTCDELWYSLMRTHDAGGLAQRKCWDVRCSSYATSSHTKEAAGGK
jgi:hypothetical protein